MKRKTVAMPPSAWQADANERSAMQGNSRLEGSEPRMDRELRLLQHCQTVFRGIVAHPAFLPAGIAADPDG